MTKQIVYQRLLWGGIMSALLIPQAKAVEHGVGIYLLGSKGPLAGEHKHACGVSIAAGPLYF